MKLVNSSSSKGSRVHRQAICIQVSGGGLSTMINEPLSRRCRRRQYSPRWQEHSEAANNYARVLSTILSEAMRQNDLASDITCDPRECGWEDVIDCIAKAKATYDEKGKSSKVRSWLRNPGAIADILHSLTGMIPDEKGLSVLRQGLVIIFQAWQTRIKNKEEILRQLEDLPLLLSGATETWKLYPRDEKLSKAAQMVYETVVGSLSELISILLRTQRGSFISKNINRIPAVESQRIDEISKTVTGAKTALAACVSRLEPERLAKIYDTSTSTLLETQSIRQTMSTHHNDMMRAIAEIVALQREPRVSDDNTIKTTVKECLQEFLAAQMQTGLYRLIQENEYMQRLGYQANMNTTWSENAVKRTMSKEHLIQHLKLTEIDSVAEDIDRIRQQESNVESEGRELARRIMSMEQFTEWITKDESKLLMLDGHCKNLGNGKTSPLSVLCASLASTLAQAQSLVILQYYCGHHALNTDHLPSGPLGLIQSLLAQLLSKPDDILPKMLQIDKELYERALPDDIDSLCEIFGAVFTQIERNKITICIIDEIAEFEGAFGGWDKSMSLVAFQLRWMVHKFQGPQRLKVLMTSANKSTAVSDLLEEDDKMSFRGSGLPNHSPRRLITGDILSLP
ncbi:hypothetical protein KVR01_012028 [Diaporthe batatas]|uniref:uncharacterized protein n=1 Tax=Diaporthe batatas TaxID=748121 RepID=UPI001D037D2A|nr:uncharacterized protein KVR01_012028 [Diaporthe batatas]KAG8158267.1 hypothetical protein KVR01_012028 [Diaporthe batatas]